MRRGRPWVPAATLRRVLEPEVAKVGKSEIARRLGARSGTVEAAERRLYAILRGEQQQVGFDTADAIITHGLRDPWLWQHDAELNAIYTTGLDELAVAS